MWKLEVIFFIFWGVAEIRSSGVPAYIKPCSKSKDFRACCIKQGNEALPFLLKGDKEFKIPNLLPLVYPKVEVDAGPNLKIMLADIKLFGLDTVTIADIAFHFDKHTIMIDLDVKHVELVGKYEIDGKILILPITGAGPINITVENNDFKYSFSYKLEKRNGNEYAIIQDNDKLEYKIGKAYFKLENLFNGNQAMGDNVNNFLNENDQDVIKELGGAIEGTIRAVARRVGGGILATIPFNQLFLE